MDVPRVAIIVSNWNGQEDTIRCLASLTLLNDMDFCVIVCDNGSDDGSIQALLEWGQQSLGGVRKGVRLVRHDEFHETTLDNFLTIIDIGGNIGFAGANNIGIRVALAEPSIQAVWLLNNDTEVEPWTLEALRRRVAADPSIGICGSTLVFWGKRTTIQSLGVHFNLALGRGWFIGSGLATDRLPDRNEIERLLTYVAGASMYVSRRFLETVGLLEESYFLYFEELDWSLRNRGRFKLAWAPDSIVYHKEGSTIGTKAIGRPSGLAIYLQNANLLSIVARHRPYLLPLTFLRLGGLAGRFLLRRDLEAALLVLRAGADFVRGDPRTYSSRLLSKDARAKAST